MAQRHDITTITFQANARGANAAIEALRQEAERCNTVVTDLKAKLKDGIKMGKSTDELDKIRADLKTADKEAKQWSKAYNELIKGMRVLDQGIKAFNDGTLNQMSAAFQKTLYNAAKLTRTKLAPDSESFREDFKQLTALMDAAQQNFAKLQGDAASMIKTLKEGGKVSVSALREEVNAQKELLSVLAETDKGYKTTQKNVAVLESYLRAMGGDYQFVRQNIQDTQKVSDEMLRNMYAELQKTNAEGKVTKDIMRENARAMKEIRAEQARRVENVLGGNLGQQSEQGIRAAIANAKELLSTYKTNSKEAQTLSAQIVNAEEHLKKYGVEAARAAAREAAQNVQSGLKTAGTGAPEITLTGNTVIGKGRPIVLVHGNGEDHHLFDTEIRQLAEAGFTVYAPDSRGHGKSTLVSDEPVTEYHYADMAEDIYQFIKELGLKKPALYGHSDGGIIALLLEINHRLLILPGLPPEPIEHHQ